jgi:hypothetical protein
LTVSETIKSFFRPAFVVCVGILLIVTIVKGVVIKKLGVQMVKEPIALRQPLDEMNEVALAPFELKNKTRIQNRDVLESLGTEEYMQWTLVDTTAEPDSPTRACSLFITYYTGNPDMVPHVPDECYVGGGNSRLAGEMVSIEIPGTESGKKVPFQYVMFGRVGDSIMKEEKFSVQYFFHANGKYSGSRTDTRLILGSNWFSKYSYFCKVEWFFYGQDAFGRIYPDKEQTLGASEKLMAKLLPELERNHWPDWEKINNE